MSFHIEHVDIIHNEGFSITIEALKAVQATLNREDFPDGVVFDEDWCIETPLQDGRLYPTTIWWCGESSGHNEETLRTILTAFDGEVDLVVIWERGEVIEGLRLRDHVVTKHKVVMTLGDEE